MQSARRRDSYARDATRRTRPHACIATAAPSLTSRHVRSSPDSLARVRRADPGRPAVSSLSPAKESSDSDRSMRTYVGLCPLPGRRGPSSRTAMENENGPAILQSHCDEYVLLLPTVSVSPRTVVAPACMHGPRFNSGVYMYVVLAVRGHACARIYMVDLYRI